MRVLSLSLFMIYRVFLRLVFCELQQLHFFKKKFNNKEVALQETVRRLLEGGLNKKKKKKKKNLQYKPFHSPTVVT